MDSPETRNWYFTYAKNFRDALAHRIPPYVPPYQVAAEDQKANQDFEHRIAECMGGGEFEQALELEDAKDRLGGICAIMAHSHADDDASPPVALHPQMLADTNTVVMAGNAYADSFILHLRNSG